MPLFKRAVQRFARACGYRIAKIKAPTAAQDETVAMTALLAAVHEPVIFDVGAHHGCFALSLRKAFPRSVIHAFEPFPESFEILKRNTASDPRIVVHNFGLAERSGTRTFHSNSNSATNSLFSTDSSGARIWGEGMLDTQCVVQASFETLDSVVERLGVAQIDLLKLDVQGAEHLVMGGSAVSCERGLIKLIYAEVLAQATYESQMRFDQALAVYYDRGFNLFGLYNTCASNEGRVLQVDCLFTHDACVLK